MRIAIIGCGSIGRRHATNLHEMGGNELLLVDPAFSRAQALAQELNAKAFCAFEDAYPEAPELAMICSPTRLHLEAAWQAIEIGCDVFVEKPLSDSMTGVSELVDAAERRGCVLFAGYNFRFDPIVVQAREWAKEGKAGHITSARFHFGSYLPCRHAEEDYRKGYGARRDLGGGVILDAVHEFDLAIWFFGMPRAIYAHGGSYSNLEIDVEDTAEIVMSYEGSVVSIHLDYLQMPAQRRLEFIGTKGSIRADLFERTVEYFDGVAQAWQRSECESNLDASYKSEMRHVMECVERRTRPMVDGRTAMQSLLLADKAKRSIGSGLAVSVDACVREMCAR